MRLNENYAFNALASFFFFNSKEETEIPAENYETIDCTTNVFLPGYNNFSYLSAFSVHDFSYLFIIVVYNGRCSELLISNTIPDDPLCSNLINKLRAPYSHSFATKNSNRSLTNRNALVQLNCSIIYPVHNITITSKCL